MAVGLGLALCLRLEPGQWWLNGDEGFYYQAATTASVEQAWRVIHSNAHPPLQYWILRGLAPFVDDPVALRLVSLIAGLLGIAAAGWLGALCGAATGAKWGNVVGSWFGAFVVALAPGLFVQAVTLRPYALCMLAITVGLASLLRYLDTGRARWLPALSLAFTVAVLQLYAAFMVVLAVGLVLLGMLIARRLTRRQSAGLLAAAAPVVAVMGWLYVTHLRPQLVGTPMHRWATDTWLRNLYPDNILQTPTLLYDAAVHTYSSMLAWLVLLMAALAAGLALVRRRNIPGFLVLALTAVAVASSLARLMPLGGSRHSLYLAPVYVAAGASGLAWAMGWLIFPAGPGAVLRRRLRSWLVAGFALLFAVPVGAYLERIVSKGLYAMLGPTLMEYAVTRESMDVVTSFVLKTPADAWLTDLQTSMLLMPLARPEDRLLIPEPAFGGSRVYVLGRRFAVVMEWTLPIATAHDDPVERALGWLASTAGNGDRRIGLVVGGWGISAAYRLAAYLRASGAVDVLAAGDPSLTAVVVDLAVLRAWRNPHTERIGEQSR